MTVDWLQEVTDGVQSADDVKREGRVCQHVADETVRLRNDCSLERRGRTLQQNENDDEERH